MAQRVSADSLCTCSRSRHRVHNTVNSADALEERWTANEVLLIFACIRSVILAYHSRNITQRLSRRLSISFRIRATSAALMAESRMFFSATRSTTFSGLSSWRNRKNTKELRTESKYKIDQDQEKLLKEMCINLVHKEWGNGARVRLIVQPEQLSPLGLRLCAWPALVPLLSLSTGSWLGSIWKMSTQTCITSPNWIKWIYRGQN